MYVCQQGPLDTRALFYSRVLNSVRGSIPLGSNVWGRKGRGKREEREVADERERGIYDSMSRWACLSETMDEKHADEDQGAHDKGEKRSIVSCDCLLAFVGSATPGMEGLGGWP